MANDAVAGTRPAEIAVIVVNYGTADLAIAAVESVLARSHGERIVDVHLVDNASPGTDAETLAAAHANRDWKGRVELHLEAENHGFGRGNNVVLEQLAARDTPPDKVFLLNPDAQLDNEALDILAGFLDGHPKAAFAGAAIATPDGTPVSAAFRFPSPLGEFVRQINFGPVVRLMQTRITSLPPDQPESQVDWVCGAAVMARFEALRALHFFEPAYFLYYEEVDLMHRAARAGWESWHVPRARVIHAEGVSTGMQRGVTDRPRKPAYWYRSWRTYFRGNYGPAGVRLAALAWLFGALANHGLSFLRRRQPSVPRAFFRDYWVLVGRPLLGLGEGQP